MIEAGVPGYEAYTFNLILGPAGLPRAVIDTLDKASRQAMADPSTIKFLEGNAAIPDAGHHDLNERHSSSRTSLPSGRRSSATPTSGSPSGP